NPSLDAPETGLDGRRRRRVSRDSRGRGRRWARRGRRASAGDGKDDGRGHEAAADHPRDARGHGAAKPSWVMALSPPGANSVTIEVIVPPVAVTTTEYCESAASAETPHGSTRTPEPGVSATVVVVTRVPSLKRNHWSVALVAVTLWMRIGVVKPTPLTGVGQKQSDLVMFGKKYFVAGADVPA